MALPVGASMHNHHQHQPTKIHARPHTCAFSLASRSASFARRLSSYALILLALASRLASSSRLWRCRSHCRRSRGSSGGSSLSCGGQRVRTHSHVLFSHIRVL